MSNESTQDLNQAFSQLPQDLLAQGTADFRVIVEGAPRPLHSVIRDEVYRIGREAVANALRHSAANTIEIALVYGTHDLRLSVRDDGCGIDPQILQSGREGHWGLSGMRERAGKIGAKLKVLSNVDNGTEVDLFVPGRIAFESHSSGGVFERLTKTFSRRNHSER